MQSTSYSHLLHSETGAEYSASRPALQNSPNLGAATLIGAGFFLLMMWSLSSLTGRSAHSATYLPPSSAITASTHSDETLADLPPSFTPVACDQLDFYHWQSDCPLTNPPLRQLRVARPAAQRQDQWRTRRKAQLAGFGPCIYCAEIKFWRSW